MNAKKAKKLRKMLKESTAGIEQTTYQQHPRTGTVACVPTCRRAMYQSLKRAV